MRVREITGGSLEPLFDLPRRLHAGAPQWVGPFAGLERRRIRHFVRRGRLRIFVAEQGGEVVGTMSALRDAKHAAHKGEGVGWFGFVEMIDDRGVAEALFDSVTEAGRAWGCDRLRGPRNLTRWDGMGLTVQGHDTLPPLMQGHHPAHVAMHVEALGFEKHHDVLAYETPVIDADGNPRQLPEPLFSQAANCRIQGLEIRALDRWRMGSDLRAAHEVLNAAFATVPDISPMGPGQFVALGRIYANLASRHLMQVARVRGRPVAFAATFPELNEALVAARGRWGIRGIARAIAARRTIRTASFKLIGVVPEYRGTGLHAKLIDQVIDGVRKAGFERLEASVIDERNKPMRAVVERAGLEIYRRWRLFERAIG